jgi:hypothetical protein
MNTNLLLAILAMDAYNRGGGAASRGLVVDGDAVGGATVSLAKVDNLTGFFAQSYGFCRICSILRSWTSRRSQVWSKRLCRWTIAPIGSILQHPR